MAERVLLILIMLGLGTDFPSCSGFLVYDYNPSSLAEALRASVEKVNSQSLSPYLFQAFRSTLKKVNALSVDTIVMHLEFSIRETTCLKDSGEDPSTCPFQRDYYEPPTTCKSTVRMSEEQVQNVWARCRWPSSSESNSSEEMVFEDRRRASRWRNSYLLGFLPDQFRSGRGYERSLELPRREFPPTQRRLPDHQRRAGVNSGFE